MKTCVGGLMIKDGLVLLGLRAAHKSHAGCWDIPGGHVEGGESLDQALVRELEEELGVTALTWTPIASGEDNGTTLYIFRITEWVGEPTLRNDEHTRLEWHELRAASALPNLAATAYAQIFRQQALD